MLHCGCVYKGVSGIAAGGAGHDFPAWSYALIVSLLQRRRSRLHIEVSIGRRLPMPVERLMKPPWKQIVPYRNKRASKAKACWARVELINAAWLSRAAAALQLGSPSLSRVGSTISGNNSAAVRSRSLDLRLRSLRGSPRTNCPLPVAISIISTLPVREMTVPPAYHASFHISPLITGESQPVPPAYPRIRLQYGRGGHRQSNCGR